MFIRFFIFEEGGGGGGGRLLDKECLLDGGVCFCIHQFHN
jgi:hypothetical protein